MDENVLVAKLSSLLEDENPLVADLILKIVNDVESSNLSAEAHAKQIERWLDQKLSNYGGGDNDNQITHNE